MSTLQQSNGCGMLLRLFVDDRYGYYSTNRLEKSEIEALIRNGIACTRLLTPDPARSLPDPSRYYRASSLEQNRQEALALESYCVSNPNIDPVALACSIAKPVMGQDSRLINLSTFFSNRSGWQYMADSQNFRGLSCCSSAAAYTTACLHDEGDKRPSDSWMHFGTSIDELIPLLPNLGMKALQATQQRIGATSIPAGHYNIAVEPTCLMKLLLPLIEAMSDYNLHQQQSFLMQYKLGDKIVSPILSLSDQPQRLGAFSACLFDFEGVRTQHTPLITKGCLQQWFITTYYSHKLGIQPVISSPNVLCIEPGTKSRQQVLDSLDNTLLITGFLGGNSNDATGDFSFGIEGQFFKHGERIQGIAGMNLTGNILKLWNHLSHVCNDVERLPDGYFPTLFFEDIEIN